MITKNEIHEKIGKKSFLSDSEMLTAKLDYQNGIEYFNGILNGKSLIQANAVIHVEKYPKGFLLKLAKGFGGIKTYNYPIANNQIRNIIINQNSEIHSLTFELENHDDISFMFKKPDNTEVSNYFSKYIGVSVDKNKKSIDKQSQPRTSESELIKNKSLKRMKNIYIPIIIFLAIISIITFNSITGVISVLLTISFIIVFIFHRRSIIRKELNKE